MLKRFIRTETCPPGGKVQSKARSTTDANTLKRISLSQILLTHVKWNDSRVVHPKYHHHKKRNKESLPTHPILVFVWLRNGNSPMHRPKTCTLYSLLRRGLWRL